MDVRVVGSDQNNEPVTAAHVRALARANAIVIVQVNASGDIVNPGGGGSGGDGAILDGADSGIKATVRNASGSVKPLHVIITNASGDMPNLAAPGGADGAIVDGADSGIKATVLDGPTARPGGGDNPLLVQFADDPTRQIGRPSPPVTGVQIVGGGVGGSVGITGDADIRDLNPAQDSVRIHGGVVGVTGDVQTLPKAGEIWPVREQAKTGVHVAAGQIGITGDVNVTATNLDVRDLAQATDFVGAHQKGGWAVSVTGDVLLRAGQSALSVAHAGPVGSQIVGGSVGARVSPSGDGLPVSQQGGWATAVTGDVSTTPAAGQTWQVREQGVHGVQIVGGGVGAKISASGDSLPVRQQGGFAVSVTGDALKLEQSYDRVIGRVAGPLGVQLVGGSGGGTVGVTGDVTVKPVPGQTFPVTQSGSWTLAGSGDVNLVDGADRSVKSTVRDYPNSNPVAVALTNASGDTYSPVPKEPICQTIPFRVTSAGTTTLAGPYNGRVIKVCAYDLQAEADTAQCKLGSGASGSQLTPQWMLNAREGVAKQVSAVGGGYIFKTLLNQALVLENAGANVRGSVTFHTGDSI